MIRMGPHDVLAPLVVETLHQRGIAPEPRRRGDVLDAVVLPQPVVGAKRTEAALGADSRPGEDDDVADAVHSPHAGATEFRSGCARNSNGFTTRTRPAINKMPTSIGSM